MRRSLPWVATGFLVAMMAVGPTPVSAGTADAPEIVDPSNDQELLDTVPIIAQPPAGTTVGLNADLQKGWVEEFPDHLLLNIGFAGTGGASINADYEWIFHMDIAGVAYEASAHQNMANQQGTGQLGDGQTSPGGVATEATIGARLLTLKVPLANIGSPTAGTVMTNLFIEVEAKAFGVVDNWITDRAPNTGAGTDYVFVGGGGAVDANDTDGDGLNDTWETDNFGNITAQNGTGDPDGDGLNNSAEFEQGTNATLADTDADGLDDGNETTLGTNATNPDTDGDGALDGEEVDAGTDPLDPNDFPVADAVDETEGPDLGNGTLNEDADSTTDGDSDGGDGDGEKAGLDAYLDSVKADTGYAGASAAGMAAVLVLSIIGLAGRWGL